MKRRFWVNRLLVMMTCLPMVQCVWRRSVTTQPAVTVKVVDAAGAPVAGAEVVVWWWSHPHSRVHERYAARTGTDGSVAFEGKRQGETIAPLCMHGVPAHEHTVCVSVEGKGHGSVELERSGQSVTVQLEPDADAGECGRFAREVAERSGVRAASGTE